MKKPTIEPLYMTVGVLAGAYKGNRLNLASLLTHTVNIETGMPFCKVKADSLCDDEYAYRPEQLMAEPTCKVCAKRDPRFKP